MKRMGTSVVVDGTVLDMGLIKGTKVVVILMAVVLCWLKEPKRLTLLDGSRSEGP